jgi:hypothetical protein
MTRGFVARLATATVAIVAIVAVPTLFASSAAASVPPPTVHAFGTAPKFKGPDHPLNAPVVAIATDASGKGFWSLTADGGVFTAGSSGFFGAPAGNPMAGPAADMVGTPTGAGYWIASALGGVYHYGDADWRGSARNENLGKPIVAIAATPTGRGYWLVTSAGRVFAYGDADHLGNAETLYVPPKIVDIAATPTGNGYALLDANGWIFAFGDAKPIATTKNTARPAAALAITPSGKGYWVLGHNGGITQFADAEDFGDATAQPVLGIDLARTKGGLGYWIATGSAFPPLPTNSGEGRRVVYSNGQQRIWLVESNGVVVNSFRVSGRLGAPPFGTYSIASKSIMSSSGSLRLPYMSRFYRASSGKWIGFHGIPLRSDGTPIQTDAQLGQPLSHGCVRMNQEDVKVVWAFTPVGTKVVVVP